MKKCLMLACLMALIVCSQAQTIVSTSVQKKNALIEEFTGIHCGYCPLGHLAMANAIAADPAHVFGIAYHQGGYATPSTGEPDYRTTFGDAIANQTGLGGYPAGTVNRHVFSGGITDYPYGSWGSACNTIKTQNAPVNIAMTVSLDYSTRLLTVYIETYYTSNGDSATHMLNVAVLQNNVKGIQSNYGNYNPTMITPDGQYLHQHMLRHLITGQWGTALTPTTTGSFKATTLTYTVPASINSIPVNLSDLEIVAFVTRGHQEVFNATGATVPAPPQDAGITAITGITDMSCANTFTPTVTLKNGGTTALTSTTINYKIDGGTVNTYNWTGSLASGATTTVTLPVQTITGSGNHTFYAYTSSPNGGTDYNTANDQTTKVFTSFISTITLPVTENFTSTTFAPTNWYLKADNSSNWTRNATYGHTAAGCAFINWYNIPSGNNDLLLNTLNLNGVTNASLSFWFAHKFYTEGGTNYTDDQLQVDASTDCGANWTTVWSQTGTALCNGTPSYLTSGYTTPVAGDWTQRTISLAAYNNAPSLTLRIRAVSGYSNNLYLDDINLTGTASAPSQPSVITGTSSPCQNTTGLSYSVTNVAGVTYTWTVPSGWTITAGQGTNSITVTAGASAASGNIVVTPSNAGGNGPSRSLTVSPVSSVAPSVSIAQTSGTNPMCAGASATFTATPTNGGTSPSFQWQVNGSNVGTGSTYTSTVLTQGQVVTCILTSNATCASPATATSTGITMTVNPVVTPANSIALTSGSNPMCAGASATFTATPTNGGTSPTYQWQVNGANVGTGSTYTTTALSQGQVVTCILTSNATCANPVSATSSGITMTVNPVVTPTISTALTSGSNPGCAGSPLTFTATTTNGGTSPFYQWQINGVNTGSNSSTFTTSALTDGQVVRCVLTSNATCATPTTATSSGITLTVNPVVTPTNSIALTAGSNPMCAGASATFTATAANGGTTPSYQWQVNGTTVGTGSTYTTTGLTDGQVVSCVLTSSASCANPVTASSNNITMTVNSTLVPAASIGITSGSNPTCAGAPITFTATPVNGGTAPSYQWLINGSNAGSGPNFTTSSLTDGQVVSCIMTSNSACASPATAISNAITIVVNAVLVPSVNIALASGTSTICQGTQVTFNATPTNGGTAPSYQWQVGGINTATGSGFSTSSLTNGQAVTCIMTSNSSCASPATVNSNSITMTVNPVVTPSNPITLTAGSNPMCSGASATFTASPVNGGSTPSYQWQINGVNAGDNTNTFTSTSLADGQVVTCILVSDALCADPATVTSNAITMTVNPAVVPTVSIALAAGTSTICEGTAVTFNATVTDGGTAPIYQWQVGGVNSGSGTSYSSASLTDGQSVVCVLISNAPCANPTFAFSNAITMIVNPIPDAPVITQNLGNLVSSYTTGNQWYNTSGAMSGETNQILVVPADGDYYAIYTDGTGCVSPASNIISMNLTGMSDNAMQQQIIAPNPTDGLVRIIFASPVTETVNAEVYDPHGKLIRSLAFDGTTEATVDLRSCADGVYLLRLNKGNETFSYRIILQK